MIRTQISLSELEYDVAKREAKRLGVSLAEFFRRALRQVLPVSSDKPWMQYCGSIETGDTQSSQHIDELIYGHKD